MDNIAKDLDHFPRSNRPPTPLEEAMIRSMLAKEEEALAHLNKFITDCKKNQDVAQQNVTMLKGRMLKAKERRDIAVQLRDGLQNGLASMQRVELPQIQASTIIHDEEDDVAHHRRELQAIRHSGETIVSGILNQIEDVELLILRQSEAVAIAREDLQGALSVEQLSHKTLKSTWGQRKKLLSSIRLKKNVFRPIWRIPHEVWNHIFRELAFTPPPTVAKKIVHKSATSRMLASELYTHVFRIRE